MMRWRGWKGVDFDARAHVGDRHEVHMCALPEQFLEQTVLFLTHYVFQTFCYILLSKYSQVTPFFENVKTLFKNKRIKESKSLNYLRVTLSKFWYMFEVFCFKCVLFHLIFRKNRIITKTLARLKILGKKPHILRMLGKIFLKPAFLYTFTSFFR